MSAKFEQTATLRRALRDSLPHSVLSQPTPQQAAKPLLVSDPPTQDAPRPRILPLQVVKAFARLHYSCCLEGFAVLLVATRKLLAVAERVSC